MDIMSHWFVSLSTNLIAPHLKEVSISLVATALFLYGEELHGLVKRQIEGCPFLLRLLILILVCAFGYGTLTLASAALCMRLLGFLDMHYLSPVVISLYLLIGILAERKKSI